MSKYSQVAFAALFLSFGAAVTLSSCGNPSSSASTSSESPQSFQIGDPVRVGGAEITVTDVFQRNDVGRGNQFAYTQAADGGVLIVVHTKIRNIGDTPLKAYNFPDIFLLDENGTKYKEDAGKKAAYAVEYESNKKLVSDLNPDISVNDAAVFEVSKSRFNQSTWVVATSNGKKISLVLPTENLEAPVRSSETNHRASDTSITSRSAPTSPATPYVVSHTRNVQVESARDPYEDLSDESLMNLWARSNSQPRIEAALRQRGWCPSTSTDAQWEQCN